MPRHVELMTEYGRRVGNDCWWLFDLHDDNLGSINDDGYIGLMGTESFSWRREEKKSVDVGVATPRIRQRSVGDNRRGIRRG